VRIGLPDLPHRPVYTSNSSITPTRPASPSAARRSGPILMVYELSSTSWGQEELDAMQRVVAAAASRWASRCAFRRAFAAHFGMKHAVMVNSGSSANLVGVAALFYRSHGRCSAATKSSCLPSRGRRRSIRSSSTG
jgi:hypothetical protein